MSEYYYEAAKLPHEFQVESREAVKTGLITLDGREIMRGPDPIGFVHFPLPAKPRIRVRAISA